MGSRGKPSGGGETTRGEPAPGAAPRPRGSFARRRGGRLISAEHVLGGLLICPSLITNFLSTLPRSRRRGSTVPQRSLALRGRLLCRARGRAVWLPQCPSSTTEGTATNPASSCSKASSRPVLRSHSGVRVPSAGGVCGLPCRRPGRRLPGAGGCCWAAAVALLAAFSASLRTTCSTRSGTARRSGVLTQDNVKKARPGTGLPYRRAKKRSSPGGCLPAVVTTTSAPARR